MKHFKIGLLLIGILLVSLNSFAQISYGGSPISETNANLSADIDHIQLRALDMELIHKRDAQDEKNGTLLKIGEMIDVDLNMDNSGTWDRLDDNRQVWRLQISSDNALALNLYFSEFDLPQGSQLFVYSPDRIQTIGAFNEKNNADGGTFSLELIYGERLIVEYVSPRPRIVDGMDYQFENLAKVNISRVNYVYRDAPDPFRGKGFGDSQNCEVNINCSEGNSWQDEKRGVARILIDGGSFSAWCTGSLVNNTAENGTPYFLSAYHCREDISETYLDSWLFYFNFEFSACNNSGIQPSSNTITGSSTVSEAELNGGSDMFLMELNTVPPASYEVVYNGWNRVNSPSSSGVGIHHPYGDVKKISTYTSSLSSATYYGGAGSTGASSAHWKVYWSSTDNGHGVTEGGSSGSPIFNADGLIVGTLSGGSSSCDATSSPDLYGKFSYHWTSNGGNTTEQLDPWLDPANTGQTELGFYNPNNSGVEASFTGSPVTINEGGTVQFSSTSTGQVESWSWTFEGGDPVTSSSENPQVTYAVSGVYDVTLSVSGGGDTDEVTHSNYITVNSGGTGDDCVWLNDPLVGTATFYTTDGGSGYVSGNNSYGDLSKVNFFDYTGTAYVTNLGFNVAYAQGSSSTIKLVVYDSNSGTPGSLLGSTTISMSSISAGFSDAGDYFEYTFDSPILVNGDFFAGIELPGGSDIFALITNTDGDVNPGTAWEEWSDGTWYNYNDESAWELNVDHAIYPEVCTSLGVNEIPNMELVNIYPNPTQSVINIESDELLNDVEIKLFNAVGACVEKRSLKSANNISIDLSNYADGLYIVALKSNEGMFRQQIQLVR
ncbi:MAG: T9SS type A sorting domain-containing protein [Bacteroidota bacterium]|nr:T9SS type A sorting domain-containing protein [Bacteroidota bacterium]